MANLSEKWGFETAYSQILTTQYPKHLNLWRFLMRIMFIGQAAFGKEVLQALIAQGENIVGAITVPDRAGKIDPIKEVSQENNITVIQPEKLRDARSVEGRGRIF